MRERSLDGALIVAILSNRSRRCALYCQLVVIRSKWPEKMNYRMFRAARANQHRQPVKSPLGGTSSHHYFGFLVIMSLFVRYTYALASVLYRCTILGRVSPVCFRNNMASCTGNEVRLMSADCIVGCRVVAAISRPAARPILRRRRATPFDAAANPRRLAPTIMKITAAAAATTKLLSNITDSDCRI